MIDQDLERVTSLEHTTFGNNGYTKNEFRIMKKDPQYTVLVYTGPNELYGYAVYMTRKHMCRILRIVVDPLYYQEGIGTQLLDRIKKGMSQNTKISMKLEDNNIVGHLFLKHNQFLATKVLKSKNSDENDQYLFEYN